MRKTLLVALLLLCMIQTIFAATEQGSYQRKSITALDSVWIFPQAQNMVYRSWAFDLDRFGKFLTYYIEMPRFDYNEIPDHLKQRFTNRANSIYDISIYSLSNLLQTTVVDEIMTILNDPEIQEARRKNFKDEASFQSFAATKAKSLGLTEEELIDLYNSAYIYLPFISSAYLQRSEEGYDTIHIDGGIIWWKIDVDQSGTSSVRELLVATTWAMGFVDYDRIENIFTFADESWYADPIEYAVNDAMLAFAKNLSVKTRQIDAFKLQAQIVESSGRTLGFPLGRNEGIHLDDGFYVIEYREDKDGNIVPYEKGYVRVSETGNNGFDPTALTYAKQIMGSRATIGDVVMENPKLGIELGLTGGLTTGSIITKEHTKAKNPSITPITPVYGLDETSESQLAFNALFMYNLAPITNVSQLFLTMDVGLAFPQGNRANSASLSVISPYFGVTKGFGGRVYANASALLGLDLLNISYETSNYDVSIDHRAFGIKAMIEAGYMLNPNWRVGVFGSYKIGFSPYNSNIEVDGRSQTVDFDTDDMRLGGVNVGIGISYSLGELPFNLFGFLDPLKQY